MTCWKFQTKVLCNRFHLFLFRSCIKYQCPSPNTPRQVQTPQLKNPVRLPKTPRSFWNLGLFLTTFFKGRKLLKLRGDFGGRFWVSPGYRLKNPHLSFRWQAPCPRHRRQLGCWSWWAHALQALGGRASAPWGGGTKGGHGTCFGIFAAELLRLFFFWYGVVVNSWAVSELNGQKWENEKRWNES